MHQLPNCTISAPLFHRSFALCVVQKAPLGRRTGIHLLAFHLRENQSPIEALVFPGGFKPTACLIMD
jgi:hypothetical protein